MKKLNKKGFTLVELLAVIVIMALLVAVAIPAVTRYLETARKGTYYDNVQAAVGAVRNDITASIVSKSNSIYYIGATSGTQPTFTGCFSIDKTTDTKGNVTQKITQNKTYTDKTSCLAAATADAPLYWADGWINNLLEKKLLNSAYGTQYSATSYIQVIKTTTATGVTNYTYTVCFIDLDGYGYCGDEAALTNSESITATPKYTAPKK